MSNVAEVKIKLSNGQEAGKTINELTAQSTQLAREIKKLEVGSEKYVKATEDYKKVASQLKDVKKEAFDTANAQSFLNSAIGDMVPLTKQIPGIAKNFQGMGAMIKGTTLAQKALNLAFKAFPLGLILGLLASFVQYLTGTVEGMNTLRRVTMPVVQVFERLKGVLQVLGGEVFRTISDIISGKTGLFEGFSRLTDAAINAGEGFKKSFTEGIEAGGKLAEMHQKIAEQQIKVTKRSAEIARDYKLQSEIAEDQSRSDLERAAAAEKAMQLSEEKYRLEAELLDMKIEKMNLEHKANDTSYEQQQELAELEAQRINLETQMSEQRTTARSKLNAALQTQRAGEKASHNEAMKEQKERLKALEDEQKAREEFIKKSIESELKAKEERKKIDTEMLAGYKAQQEEEFNQKMESLLRMQEAEQRMIDQLWFTNQISQETRDQMMYEAQKTAFKERLTLLEGSGKATTEKYQEIFQELLKLNFDYETKTTETAQEEEEKRKTLRLEGFRAASGIAAGFASLLAESAKTNKKSLAVMKAAQTAEVGINTITEVSGIFKSTSGWGPLGWAAAILQAGIATARGASAVKRIQAIEIEPSGSFAEGGPVFGPSHDAGGIPFGVKGTSGRFEMEGGEIILTKGVFQDPVLRAIASDLNAMGGGRKFALGGPVLTQRTESIGSNFPASVSSIGQGTIPGLLNAARTEEYLKIIAEASVKTANKPVLSTMKIREELNLIDEVERDATF